MCGIAGIWSAGALNPADAIAMANALAHRGPNDAGIWHDAQAGIALSHRRLSIIDPSPAGHQPMLSPCGRYILSFNGEIYNHLAIRATLEAGGAIAWRGHSDTETLLHAIARFGLDAALKQAVGMFALAIWDREARTLSLARDRIGEKPLYYGWFGGGIVFGSELKALRAVPGFAAETSPDALSMYLRHNCVPAPWSIFKHVFKVEPGAIVTLDRQALAARPALPPGASATPGIDCRRYWSLDSVVSAGTDPTMDADGAVEGLRTVLLEAVRSQMVADVPVGAFLSGGVDSSAIVALMKEASQSPIRTFTIGFAEQGFDEAPYARAVARHLGTQHEELYVDANEVRSVISELPRIYDEPFADSSQMPTVLLSRMTRRSVTVALSGDGGDELFCGYNRYMMSRRFWAAAAAVPPVARGALASGIAGIAPQRWDALAALPIVPTMPMLGLTMHKIARMLRTPLGTLDIYRESSEQWQSGLPMDGGPYDDFAPEAASFAGRTPEEEMMRWDTQRYLPNDILTKVDRASMASSLEVRVPFLDHRVVEAAWRTPLAFKKRAGQSKWMLRQVLYRHVPPALIERPKAGFAIPIGEWLRHALRDWAEDLLSEEALRAVPLVDGAAIRRRWAEHRAGTRDRTASLWAILMYQSWARTC